MSSDLSAANLRSLRKRFRTPAADNAVRFLTDHDNAAIAWTLESHLLRSPTDEDALHRERVDALLAYFGMLELALLTGAVEPPLPAEDAEEARRLLALPPLRRFYEHYYPVLLPTLLRQRLSGRPVRVDGVADGSRLLSRFIATSALLDNPETQIFLAFLDDKYAGDDDLGSVLRIVRDGERFVETMALERGQWTHGQEAVHGFLRFLAFATEFDRFLSPIDRPLLQSAFWHYHGYWFQLIGGQVLGVLTAGIEALRHYAVPATAEDMRSAGLDEAEGYDPAESEEDAAATRRAMDESIRGLQRLTSSVYRYALDRYVRGPRVPLMDPLQAARLGAEQQQRADAERMLKLQQQQPPEQLEGNS